LLLLCQRVVLFDNFLGVIRGLFELPIFGKALLFFVTKLLQLVLLGHLLFGSFSATLHVTTSGSNNTAKNGTTNQTIPVLIPRLLVSDIQTGL